MAHKGGTKNAQKSSHFCPFAAAAAAAATAAALTTPPPIAVAAAAAESGGLPPDASLGGRPVYRNKKL